LKFRLFLSFYDLEHFKFQIRFCCLMKCVYIAKGLLDLILGQKGLGDHGLILVEWQTTFLWLQSKITRSFFLKSNRYILVLLTALFKRPQYPAEIRSEGLIWIWLQAKSTFFGRQIAIKLSIKCFIDPNQKEAIMHQKKLEMQAFIEY